MSVQITIDNPSDTAPQGQAEVRADGGVSDQELEAGLRQHLNYASAQAPRQEEPVMDKGEDAGPVESAQAAEASSQKDHAPKQEDAEAPEAPKEPDWKSIAAKKEEELRNLQFLYGRQTQELGEHRKRNAVPQDVKKAIDRLPENIKTKLTQHWEPETAEVISETIDASVQTILEQEREREAAKRWKQDYGAAVSEVSNLLKDNPEAEQIKRMAFQMAWEDGRVSQDESGATYFDDGSTMRSYIKKAAKEQSLQKEISRAKTLDAEIERLKKENSELRKVGSNREISTSLGRNSAAQDPASKSFEDMTLEEQNAALSKSFKAHIGGRAA